MTFLFAATAKSLQSYPTLCDPIDGAAHQAPLSLGFSRQEHWSGLPFPSPMHESHSVVLTLYDPMDCSLPGSSVHGIFQARVLEWGAITLSRHLCFSSVQSCPALCDPMNRSTPGLPVHHQQITFLLTETEFLIL